MKRTFWMGIVTIACMLSTQAVLAQVYPSAIGLRFGYPATVSYKHFISSSAAIEGNVGLRRFSDSRWTNISGAYLLHFPISPDFPELQWYAGAGASILFWRYDDGFLGSTPSASTGLQGYLGLDYAFENIPINLTLDWVPFYFLSGQRGFNADFGGLAIRYIIP